MNYLFRKAFKNQRRPSNNGYYHDESRNSLFGSCLKLLLLLPTTIPQEPHKKNHGELVIWKQHNIILDKFLQKIWPTIIIFLAKAQAAHRLLDSYWQIVVHLRHFREQKAIWDLFVNSERSTHIIIKIPNFQSQQLYTISLSWTYVSAVSTPIQPSWQSAWTWCIGR